MSKFIGTGYMRDAEPDMNPFKKNDHVTRLEELDGLDFRKTDMGEKYQTHQSSFAHAQKHFGNHPTCEWTRRTLKDRTYDKAGCCAEELESIHGQNFTFCPYCGYRIIVAIIKKARAK
jgi:DNA-directed RNA polymerase subunit RPC12/RpoP